MPSSSASHKGQWFLMTSMLIISVIIGVTVISHSVRHMMLSNRWKTPYLLYFISTVNSLKRMPPMSGELKSYYYEFYERVAERHGIYLNISDTPSGTRVKMMSPTFMIDRVI